MNNLKYEFFYNAHYAREHNPTVMQFGLTGGFGCYRASMCKAVKGGDMIKAEMLFWLLIYQNLVEAKQEEDVIGIGTMDEMMECWFDHLLDNETPETNFVRLAQEGSKWDKMYTAFLRKHYPDNYPGKSL